MTTFIILSLALLAYYFSEKANTEKEVRISKEYKAKIEHSKLKSKLKETNHEKRMILFIDKIKQHQLKITKKSTIEDCKIRIKDFYKEFDHSELRYVSNDCFFTYMKIVKKKSYRRIKIIEKSFDFTQLEITYEIKDYKLHKSIENSLTIDDLSSKTDSELWTIYANFSAETEKKLIIKTDDKV